MIAKWQVTRIFFYPFFLSPFYVLWMLIPVSFSDSPSLAFISGRRPVWLTCLRKGEQHHIGPKASSTKKVMIKEVGSERDPPASDLRISPQFLSLCLHLLVTNSHLLANASLGIFLSTGYIYRIPFFLVSAPPLTQPLSVFFLLYSDRSTDGFRFVYLSVKLAFFKLNVIKCGKLEYSDLAEHPNAICVYLRIIYHIVRGAIPVKCYPISSFNLCMIYKAYLQAGT